MNTAAYRIDKEVFRMPRELHKECLMHGVTSSDIKRHRNNWLALGIDPKFATQQTAALRALEDKKRMEAGK